MTGMFMPLLPQWLRIAWAAALSGALVLHLVHALRMSGETRRWHIGHTIMAAGMIAMYLLPQSEHPAIYRLGVTIFGVLAVAVVWKLTVSWIEEGQVSWLWAGSFVGMGAMAYMSIPRDDYSGAASYLLIACLSAEATLWLTARRCSSSEGDAMAPAATRQGGAAGDADPHAADTAGIGVATLVRTPLFARSTAIWRNRPESDVTLGVRITLAVMAASMAWMLVAMQ